MSVQNTSIRNRINKCRKDFERCTEMYYEGDFAKYEDDTYVSDQQQDDFTMFRSGWEAAMNMGDASTRKDEVKND